MSLVTDTWEVVLMNHNLKAQTAPSVSSSSVSRSPVAPSVSYLEVLKVFLGKSQEWSHQL